MASTTPNGSNYTNVRAISPAAEQWSLTTAIKNARRQIRGDPLYMDRCVQQVVDDWKNSMRAKLPEGAELPWKPAELHAFTKSAWATACKAAYDNDQEFKRQKKEAAKERVRQAKLDKEGRTPLVGGWEEVEAQPVACSDPSPEDREIYEVVNELPSAENGKPVSTPTSMVAKAYRYFRR
ncbi:hypothetical protein EJ08DRAFT_657559 [Tothia fuscella]|uniref:Uncharacterized protein n=1 Tax=Tothia fuscella TaxID=1048955 RepID=A0A9P4P0A1_9PEZI|nr:hypothetical protein EJ08DRAFT_657559 [Tothia fuscella]